MTAEHTDESLVVDSVESGTEVEQHQSTDITVIDRSGISSWTAMMAVSVE